jgi:hypothetical protein
MISELLILAFALILGAYWFRYNCLAILKTRCSRERAELVASANQLAFLEVIERLEGQAAAGDFDRLHRTLQHDYMVLTALLRYSSTLPTGGHTVDERLLMVDFRLLQGWYAVVHSLASGPARRALEERARILVHFANRMAERSAALTRA